jgi:hypothetical protein
MCASCGAPLTPGAGFCSECGRPISGADARPTTQLPDHARGPVGNAPPPNPYAPGPGFAPPGPPPAGGAGPYAAPPPPGGYPIDPTYHPPGVGYGGANPYGAYPPPYPYARPAAPRRGAALLWIGVGLLTLTAFLLLCALAFAVFGFGADNFTSAAEANSASLGLAVCVLGALFLLGVPGAILVFVGRRH